MPLAIDRLITVGANAQPARFLARAMTRKQSKAYLYQFAHRPKTAKGRSLGAYHGADLAYIFGNLDASNGYDAADRALSETLMNYWTQFAHSGNPNAPGWVVWPAYTTQEDASIEFSDAIRVRRHLWKKESDFFDRVLHYR